MYGRISCIPKPFSWWIHWRGYFFVISGYLITVLIFQDLYNGTFNFSKFYAQRIRRIFPALILILVFCLGFGWLALLPDEFKQLGNHISASAVFINNIALLRETGNFDNTAETKPLLHLWSLSIDNQRYREKRRYYLGSTCR